MATRRRTSTRGTSAPSKSVNTFPSTPPRVSSTRRKRAAAEEVSSQVQDQPSKKKRKDEGSKQESNQAPSPSSAPSLPSSSSSSSSLSSSSSSSSSSSATTRPDTSMAPPPAPTSPTSPALKGLDDETAKALLVMHSSPARSGGARSPQRPRRASFATEVAHMLVSPTKHGDNFQNDPAWMEASLHAASILSEMSPISTPVKKKETTFSKNGKGREGREGRVQRSGGGGNSYRNKPGAYSPFSNFASSQLSPLVSSMNGAASGGDLHSSFPVNLQNWDFSVGATPSPMRAAIANGHLSLVGSLMSPAPGSIGSIRGSKMGRNGGRGPGFAQRLDFALDPDAMDVLGGSSSSSSSSSSTSMMNGGTFLNGSSSSSFSSRKKKNKKNQKRPMKFMLQPNGGLSQGLHPMGDFFDRSPTAGSGIPPDDMFDPLSVRVCYYSVLL